MTPTTPDDPSIVTLIDRVLPAGRTIARFGAGLNADDPANFFYHALTQATGDDLIFGGDKDDARVTRIIDAAYAIGVATGLHLRRGAFGKAGA